MYTFTSDLKKEEYDKFIENYPMASFMQEYNWANVKDNWNSFHCGLYKDEKLVGVCLILVKKVFKNISTLNRDTKQPKWCLRRDLNPYDVAITGF